jgi:hypothetical protein
MQSSVRAVTRWARNPMRGQLVMAVFQIGKVDRFVEVSLTVLGQALAV